jgi:hypothetical protein
VIIPSVVRWRGYRLGIGVITMHVLPWPYTLVATAAAGAFLGYRLLAERARRQTVIALVERSPSGTVVFLEAGPGGPAMWVQVGAFPRPSSRGGRGER